MTDNSLSIFISADYTLWEGRVTMHVGGEGDNACGRGRVTMHVGGEG